MLAVQANEPNEPGWNRIGAAILRPGEQSFEFPFNSSFSVLNLQATRMDGQPYFMHFVFGALAHAGPREAHAKLTVGGRSVKVSAAQTVAQVLVLGQSGSHHATLTFDAQRAPAPGR